MTTLYIDRKQAHLALEGQSLVVRFKGERQRPVPVALLERVVLLGTVELDSRVLLRLAEAGVAVQLSSKRQPAQRALVLGAGHKDVTRRQLQYRLSLDKRWCLRFAQDVLLGKLRSQQRMLKIMLVERSDQRKSLLQAQTQLSQLEAAITQATQADTLLGLEGAAARASFAALAAVLPSGLGFAGRKRRPPPDPVNACLSLGYTLLYGRAVQALHAQGLEPQLGFYHEPAWGRASLAADLMEPWRPYVDEWVWQMFRQQYLREAHFRYEQGACYLTKAGSPLFFARVEELLRPISRALRLQVRALLRAMEADDA